MDRIRISPFTVQNIPWTTKELNMSQIRKWSFQSPRLRGKKSRVSSWGFVTSSDSKESDTKAEKKWNLNFLYRSAALKFKAKNDVQQCLRLSFRRGCHKCLEEFLILTQKKTLKIFIVNPDWAQIFFWGTQKPFFISTHEIHKFLNNFSPRSEVCSCLFVSQIWNIKFFNLPFPNLQTVKEKERESVASYCSRLFPLESLSTNFFFFRFFRNRLWS